SRTSAGTTVTTNWLRGEGGLRLRGSLGDEARFVGAIHGGLVKERFGMSGDPSLSETLPDVDYLFFSAGADGRLRPGPIAPLAAPAYLPALASGATADRFRGTKLAAVELGGGFAIPIVSVFEARATVAYTRVFYSFEPAVGDVNVA